MVGEEKSRGYKNKMNEEKLEKELREVRHLSEELESIINKMDFYLTTHFKIKGQKGEIRTFEEGIQELNNIGSQLKIFSKILRRLKNE